MFASNQIFTVTGSMDQLEKTTDFAIRHSGNHEMFTRYDRRVSVLFQITKSGLYCIASGRIKGDQNRRIDEGWQEYPFDYDPSIIAGIVKQWISSQPRPRNEYSNYDGGHDVGFQCDSIWGLEPHERETIQNPFFGIICFRPFENWYSK